MGQGSKTSSSYGPSKGVESVRTAIQAAAKTGVQHLTLFAFSSENWNRPADEVKGLMKLFLVSLRREIAALNKANVRVRLVGDLTAFSEELQEQIADSMKITENNTGLTLNVCVNYGGRWEILEAAKRCRDIPLEELTEQNLLRCFLWRIPAMWICLSVRAGKSGSAILCCGSLLTQSCISQKFYGPISPRTSF